MYFIPTNLRVDYGKTMVTDSSNPVFTWGAAHEGIGRKQSACRVEVNRENQKIWDSGWVDTESQSLIYKGPGLVSGSKYSFSVCIRDNHGLESGTAERAFITGLYEKWESPWIAAGDDEESGVRYFRYEFTSGEGLERAALFVCGVGLSRAFLNGGRCDGHMLSPVISDYSKRCYYTVSDITDMVAPGANCAGIVLADGWRRNNGHYLIHLVMKNEEAPLFGLPALTAAIRLEYKGGRVEWVHTGEHWQCGKGPVTAAHLFNGEQYDARNDKPGWDKPGFDAAGNGFRPAVISPEPPAGELQAQTLEPIRVTKEYKAVSMDVIEPGRWVFDFGQNIAGVTRLFIPPGLPPGVRITIRHAEVLDENGELYTTPLRGAEATDSYITGGETDAWSPAFTYHGFRYAEISGYPGVPDRATLTALAINTDVKNGSFFESGNSLVNAIQKMAVQTELANIHGILTDCPQRDERMGWMNDATVRFVETPYNFEIGRLFPKVVGDVRDEQDYDGAITCTAPFIYGSRPADPVCSSFLIAADMARIFTGNMETLKKAYPAFCAWNDYLAANSEDGIVGYSKYGDWAGPARSCLGENGALSAVTPGIYMSTGYHYYNSVLLAKFAEMAGRPEDVKKHKDRAAYIRKSFLDKWFDKTTGVAGTGSQGCQAFALWLGILPEESRKNAADALNRKVLSDGLQITTGSLTTYYLLEMLAEYGYVETAWALLTRTEYPSWGYMHEHGATTVWERFELMKYGGMNSHSHPMYGAVGAFFYRSLCGVTSDHTGFGRFRVRPVFPAGLRYVQGVVETCRGDIRVMWHKKYGALHVTVAVPFGTEAEIILPGIREIKGSGVWRYQVKEKG